MQSQPQPTISNALVTHSMDLHGDPVTVLERDGNYYVAMKPLCAHLGIDWEAQRQLLMRDPVLSSTACVIQAVAEDGKKREMVCLPLEYLNGWLFKLDVSRYDGPVRDKLIRYQRECYQVLYEHFVRRRSVDVGPLLEAVQNVQAVVCEALERVETLRATTFRQENELAKHRAILEDIKMDLLIGDRARGLRIPARVVKHGNRAFRVFVLDGQLMVAATDWLGEPPAYYGGSVGQRLKTMGLERDRDWVVWGVTDIALQYGTTPSYFLGLLGLGRQVRNITLLTPMGLCSASRMDPEFGAIYRETLLPLMPELMAVYTGTETEVGHA